MIDGTQSNSFIARALNLKLPLGFRDNARGYGVGSAAPVFGCLSIVAVPIAFLIVLGSLTAPLVLVFTVPLALLVAVLPTALSRYFGEHHAHSLQSQVWELVKQGRYVLYLRSFKFDGTTLTRKIGENGFSRRVGWEEALASWCVQSDLGLTAVGGDGRFGAASLASSDADWQAITRGLMEEARLIVIVPAATEGSFWEIAQIWERKWLSKSVWIMPPAHMTTSAAISAAYWENVRVRCHAEMDIQLPPYSRGGAIFAYSLTSNGNAEVEQYPFSTQHVARVIYLARKQEIVSEHLLDDDTSSVTQASAPEIMETTTAVREASELSTDVSATLLKAETRLTVDKLFGGQKVLILHAKGFIFEDGNTRESGTWNESSPVEIAFLKSEYGAESNHRMALRYRNPEGTLGSLVLTDKFWDPDGEQLTVRGLFELVGEYQRQFRIPPRPEGVVISDDDFAAQMASLGANRPGLVKER